MKSKNVGHAELLQFFSAEDATRLALMAYYAASRHFDALMFAWAHADDRELRDTLDQPWFVGEWMQRLSEALRDDPVTASNYKEIIARWEREDNPVSLASQGNGLPGPVEGDHNGPLTGAENG